MSNKAKGARREREARQHYEAAGYAVQPFYGRRYGETDGFNLFDLIALAPEREPHLVQVKSNRAAGIVDWADSVTELCGRAPVRCLYAVCYDREGWRLIEAGVGGRRETIFDGRTHDGAMGEPLARFLSGGPP